MESDSRFEPGQKRRNWVIALATVLIGVSIAHVLEDFVYGIPAQFGLEVVPAAALVGLAYAGHVMGYLGNLVAGVIWLVAASVDHLDEVLFATSYRTGLISKGFEAGLMLSAVGLMVSSFAAWRSRRRDLK